MNAITLLLAAIAILLVVAAVEGAEPSPQEQAIGARLVREINASLACDATVIDLQAKLRAAQEELTKLKTPPDKK